MNMNQYLTKQFSEIFQLAKIKFWFNFKYSLLKQRHMKHWWRERKLT